MQTELALIQAGVITAEDYVEALLRREEERPRMGQLAIEGGLLSARQVRDIVTRQYASPGLRFGEVAVEAGQLTAEQVEDLIQAQAGRQRPVIEHLIEFGCVTRSELLMATRKQPTSELALA